MPSSVPDNPSSDPPPGGRDRAGRRVAPVLRLPLARQRPEAPPADLREALERAASRVCDEWEREVGDGLAGGEVAPHVAVLCDMILRCAAAGKFDDPAPAFPTTVSMRRMLDRVRQTLLDDVAALGSAVDTVELVTLLRAVEHTQSMIERDAAQRFANRLAGPDGLELLVDVAHDIRSPLTSILFLAETLHGKRSGTINAVQERQLGLIYSAAFALSSITNDVIELARGGDRLLDKNPVPFSVADIMQSARDSVLPVAEEKGLEIRLHVPEADSRVGQPTALNRVLLNLTTNALKFTDAGYVEMAATPLSRTRLEFSVRDTGRGLAPEVLAALFEPFRRRYRPGEYTFSSSGLGLSICRKLVAGMGGELRFDSVAEQGTRFYFALDLPSAATL
ncbi:MAG: HAMP domain-containing histidine kinase [Gemmatimonadota bacterium]|nr:HAMP domain-containing histidine kinase [Gemmatimonadota bacterium]